MKPNYFLFIILFFIVLFRNVFITSVNNIGYLIFYNKDNLTINLLNQKINYLEKEYNDLLSFNNKVSIKYDYNLTNLYKNNYGYDKLYINGEYNIGDKVVNNDGLIGVISKVNNYYSEVDYIYNLRLPVKINDYEGKIVNSDEHNLIVKEITSRVDINDKVYTIDDIYIGKVIKIIDNDLDKMVIVKTIDLNNINYVGVISR